MTSEIQPQSTSYESVLREQEVQYQQTSPRPKVIEFHEARLRIHLQTEESMIFSIQPMLWRVIRKWDAGHEAVSKNLRQIFKTKSWKRTPPVIFGEVKPEDCRISCCSGRVKTRTE